MCPDPSYVIRAQRMAEAELEEAKVETSDKPLSILRDHGIPERYLNVLLEHGYNYEEEIYDAGPEKIEAINGIGEVMVSKIFEILG